MPRRSRINKAKHLRSFDKIGRRTLRQIEKAREGLCLNVPTFRETRAQAVPAFHLETGFRGR